MWGERANVLHPRGRHLGNAAGLWFYEVPASCTAGMKAVTLQGKEGVLQLGGEAEGYPRGDLEQGPGFQISASPSVTKNRRNALGEYNSSIYSPKIQQMSRDIVTEVPPILYNVNQSRLSAAWVAWLKGWSL